MNTPRILVGGIGNIFLGDDAFGVEVVKRLKAKRLPRGVEVVDFGIKGIDLTYALLDDYGAAILVDAIPRGERPGTLYVIEPEEEDEGDAADLVPQTHSLDPASVLRLVRRLGGRIDPLLLVGCEPTPPDVDDMLQGLSAPVAAVVEEAVRTIESLIEKMSGKQLGVPS